MYRKKLNKFSKRIALVFSVAAMMIAGSLNVRADEIDLEETLVVENVDLENEKEDRFEVDGIDESVGIDEADETLSDNEIDIDDEALLSSADRDSAYVDSVSLLLGSDIGINFYIDAAKLTNNTVVRINEESYNLANYEADVDGMKKLTYRVSPKCLGDDITVYVNGYSYSYSIRQLLNEVCLGSASSDKFKTLCRSIDNYGKCAQMYFDYEVDSSVSNVSVDSVDVGGRYLKVVNGELPYGLDYLGSSLVITDTVSFRHYFKIFGDKRIGDFTFKSGSNILTPIESGDVCYIQFSNIPAVELGDAVEMDVNNTWRIYYSPLSYLASASLDKCSPKLLNLCRAMYWYYVATMDYFNIECKSCPHSFETTVLVDPSSTTIGKNKYVCAHCGYAYIGIVEKVTKKCNHYGYKSNGQVTREATETVDGLVEYICTNCGGVKTSHVVPANKEYKIDLGKGEYASVYGYFDRTTSKDIFTLLNEYRTEQGRASLNYAKELQDEADIRALETSYRFSHTRPDDSAHNSDNIKYMNAENIAMAYSTPETTMQAWKESTGHNRVMLGTGYKSVATSTFVRVTYVEGSLVPRITPFSVQEFSLYESPPY